ncbi:MAG: hypothetical protein N2506_03635 [Dehalococcoidales bacterium]|nr:hypothetical protein [Dehalococcoidales bacterium]
MLQIRKTYREVNPELLSAEIRDFILKQGAVLGESKLETYTQPDDTASFITRSTMTFRIGDRECVLVHMVGSTRGETRLMIDVDETLFPREKLNALQADLDFIFGSYETK